MAELIGCRPRIWEYLGSIKQLQAYLLSITIPLRYRMRGRGAILNGKERYVQHVAKVYGHGFGKFVKSQIIMAFFTPTC